MQIKYNHDTKEWEGITVEKVKFWENCYPDVNVVDILTKRMPAWLLSNPGKAKKKNWLRFINNWLSREQSKYDEIRFKNKYDRG